MTLFGSSTVAAKVKAECDAAHSIPCDVLLASFLGKTLSFSVFGCSHNPSHAARFPNSTALMSGVNPRLSIAFGSAPNSIRILIVFLSLQYFAAS